MGFPCYSENTANTSTQSASWSSVSELHLAVCFIVTMSLVCCGSIFGQLASWVTSVSLLLRKTVLRVHPWLCLMFLPHNRTSGWKLAILSCSVNPLQMMFFLTFCLRWPLLRTNRSHLLPSYSHRRETALEGKDPDDDARGETDVLCVRALHGIKMQSHRGHLTCPSPARLCTSSGQQCPPRPGSRAPSSLLQCSCSPSISFNCFKIMVAVCFACLTDSSGSGWLPPWTLSRFFLILTALLTHLVTTDPSAWLLCSSLCSVLCFIHQIVRVSYYNLCGTW